MNATTTSMVMIVVHPVLITVLDHVIEMERAVHVVRVSMHITAAKTAQKTVQVHVNSKMEDALVAKI